MERDIELLRRLGGLRDAMVEEIVWRKADRSLRLSIVAGQSSGVVIFTGIDGVAVETALFRGVFQISGIDVDTRSEGLEVRIGLSESDIRLRCKDITVRIGD